MRGLGIVCSINKGRPVVTGIVIEATDSGEKVVDRFKLIPDQREDFLQQLVTLGDDLSWWCPCCESSVVHSPAEPPRLASERLDADADAAAQLASAGTPGVGESARRPQPGDDQPGNGRPNQLSI
jgi:hypothetical protein